MPTLQPHLSTSKALCLELQRRGYRVWYDNAAADLTKETCALQA